MDVGRPEQGKMASYATGGKVYPRQASSLAPDIAVVARLLLSSKLSAGAKALLNLIFLHSRIDVAATGNAQTPKAPLRITAR